LPVKTAENEKKTALPEKRPYHHGDLKAALLKEAETILEEDGIQALTLRAASRAVGVAHTAPKNHFGDLTGLLSELAAIGFNRFSEALVASIDPASDDPKERMNAMGRAYVGFAREHPGLFSLMFRSERLDVGRPALRDAIQGARNSLRRAVLARTPDKEQPPLRVAAQSAALWSLVHGFSVLLLEGRFDGLLQSLPGEDDADTLLAEILAVTKVGD
jgi:AcrR family transcriptional regulator